MHAFVVWFRNLARWDVKFFTPARWQWPKEVIHPLADVLRRKVIPVDRNGHRFDDLCLVSIHFDGSMERRDLRGKKDFKGRLFFADAGDVVYSKIDVRNGAIGVVPDDLRRIAVSSEYPVYSVDRTRLLAPYVQLLFRTSFFREKISAMVSGTSGRKRVNPEQLEMIQIPVPPLSTQQASVEHHRRAQEEARNARENADHLEQEVSRYVLKHLGVSTSTVQRLRGPFLVCFKDLERWSVEYNEMALQGIGQISRAKYPVRHLGEFARVSYGIQKSPANRPGQHARPYLRVANVQRGELDLREVKWINVLDEEMPRFRLQPGDLLLCEGNSADLVGRPALWNGEIADCVHQNHILKVRSDRTKAEPEFLLAYMNTAPARLYFRSRAKQTTNLATINSNDVCELPVPLPPLPVQQEIVTRVKELRAEIAAERRSSNQIDEQARREVEEMILGTRPVSVGHALGREHSA